MTFEREKLTIQCNEISVSEDKYCSFLLNLGILVNFSIMTAKTVITASQKLGNIAVILFERMKILRLLFLFRFRI